MSSTYKDLIVWQKGVALTIQIYQQTKAFPKDETFGLISQMRRAAVSIPSNIAEGHSRQTTREYIQFAQIAFGSAAELETQTYLAYRLKYLSEESFRETSGQLTEILKMLNQLISTLKRKIK